MRDLHVAGSDETARSDRSKRLAVIALWGAVFLSLYFVQDENFLLFHSLAEIFSVVIAGTVFLVSWNSRTRMESDFLLLVGIAYGFIALLDVFHLLSYAGMGVFPAHTADLPTQLWLAARYLEAGTLAVGTAFIGENRLTGATLEDVNVRETTSVVLVYGAITAALLGAIFLGLFPAAYVPDVGLTRFKIVSEYLVILLLAAALWQLFRSRDEFDEPVARHLAAALLLTMAAEFSFTLYVSVYGWSNAVGHLLKIASFYFIYLSVIRIGVTSPQEILFRQLKDERDDLVEREQRLEQQNERLEAFAGIVSHDLRNPLNVARGNVELVQEECDSEHLGAIERSHDRMEALIEDLLELARAGRTITDDESIPLDEQAETSWDHVDATGATLVVETDATVRADATRLTQLFENLFGNAIAHGGETVTVRVGTLDDERGFYVEDDGKGIPESDRAEIFDHGYSTSRGRAEILRDSLQRGGRRLPTARVRKRVGPW